MKSRIYKLFDRMGFALLKKEVMHTGVLLHQDLVRHCELSDFHMVIDAGANHGVMSRYFVDHFPNATVHAFEPVPSTYTTLLSHCKKIDRIVTVQKALSNREGHGTIYLQADSGLNSLNEKVNSPEPSGAMEKVTVEVTTLNTYASAHGIKFIDLLKTDTEGLDLKVMQGASDFIDHGKVKYILTEVGFNEDDVRNTSFEEARKYLNARGFRLRGFYDQSNFGNKTYLTCANALFQYQGD